MKDVSKILFVWMLRIFRNNHIIIQQLLFKYLEETAAVAQWATAFASQEEAQTNKQTHLEEVCIKL